MKRHLRPPAQLLLSMVVILGLPWGTLGQETPPADQPIVANSDDVPVLTAAEVVASLVAVDADTAIEESQKATLRAKYKQITELLQKAEDFASATRAHRASLDTAPKSAAENRDGLEALPSIEASGKIDVEGDSADVRKSLDSRQATLQGLSDELARVAAELLKTESRPVKIGTRLRQAQRELSTIRNQWEGLELADTAISAAEQAERFLLQAEYMRLLNEIEMMRQEKLSQSVREQELKSRRDLLDRHVKNERATVDALDARLETELTRDVDRVHLLARMASEKLSGDASVQELAAEISKLARQFEGVVENLKLVAPAGREAKDRLEEVRSEYRSIRTELNLGSGGRDLAQVLLELGLLEFSVLRTSTIEAGTRNAIYTLCQYAVIGLALVALSNILKLDWAKFGWMAAALSVGLGFGLQEVVANFVCGLIVLFERPIRVGDVVTIEGTTGTVTNINMRATTITNWDRQDFVVPNKNLITGTILNWTLSTSVNRVVIPVGVAYGTNTAQARQILLDVAAEHPKVLDDPKPLASFEQFADSSLSLALRAYLPNLDNRLGTITELHTEIMMRFAAAGIEIPFPQQDFHLRSGADRLDQRDSMDDSFAEFGKPH
jgi:small-conductance mechanosensitive channel